MKSFIYFFLLFCWNNVSHKSSWKITIKWIYEMMHACCRCRMKPPVAKGAPTAATGATAYSKEHWMKTGSDKGIRRAHNVFDTTETSTHSRYLHAEAERSETKILLFQPKLIQIRIVCCETEWHEAMMTCRRNRNPPPQSNKCDQKRYRGNVAPIWFNFIFSFVIRPKNIWRKRAP